MINKGVIKLKDLLIFLEVKGEEYQFYGNEEEEITGYSSLDYYQENTMTWARSIEYIKRSEKGNYKLIILPQIEDEIECQNYIKVEDPHRAFFYILEEFFSSKTQAEIGVNSIIDETAKIGQNVSIGYNCVIGKNVFIGDNTRIYHNVVIADNVVIGKNCLIKSGAIIGEEGFGFLKTKEGLYQRVVHLGSVILEDNVEVGVNTNIDRGVMQNVVIGFNSKIDSLCHIAHNVEIGSNTVVVAETCVGGSTKIGKNCWIGTSSIKNLLTIGDNAFIGFGSNVVSDIEENTLAYGNPAKAKGKID
ncbi:UDP-3-O-(3-hydroxymyristoyl)glucosamine N-acyltransferase [Anaerosacchariphilus polymeriproducens]|uniref:UDP-3-O-(3-hydroxymyristoyl)glucosamine N-acyltransferase n=1 Tax=Anaerosacchariphilus polymeriproducens TaxID=1812858 RepID=A0A371ARC6_9FIRM|nr:UDP-3-O-(3-hydroxymyristoyl)glucosamine N-acyltransferase [Anaerosacchariphilus polymeriproducens]RDU22108.1 UDP-3-O-(3-hydroxymyristoyl)glucosamine N-acyltransferase [Anaerosacchariphilus polymeriproducens]